MVRKNKKKTFKPLKFDDLEEKSSKNEGNSNITKKTQNDYGIHRKQDILLTTEKINDGNVKIGKNSDENIKELSTKDTDISTGSYLNKSLDDKNIEPESPILRSHENDAGKILSKCLLIENIHEF